MGPTDGTVGVVVRNAAATGEASLLLDANNQNGVAELKALAGGGVMLNSFQQFINNTSGLTNLAIEPNIGGSNDAEVIFGYGFVNLSDRALKENVRAIPEEELQQIFDAVVNLRPHRRRQGADRLRGPGRAGQWEAGRDDVQDQNLDGRELMTLDYQKLSVVLWGVVKSLQKRVEKLEKKKRGHSN